MAASFHTGSSKQRTTPGTISCTSVENLSVGDALLHCHTKDVVLPIRVTALRKSELLQHFQKRWKREYLTTLREHHKTTGNNRQNIKVGDIVTVYDDIPRINWKLAVIEQLTTGLDGYTRVAETTLFPLEVNEDISDSQVQVNQTADKTTDRIHHQQDRPTKQATIAAHRRLREWSDMIRTALEDVMDSEQ